MPLWSLGWLLSRGQPIAMVEVRRALKPWDSTWACPPTSAPWFLAGWAPDLLLLSDGVEGGDLWVPSMLLGAVVHRELHGATCTANMGEPVCDRGW